MPTLLSKYQCMKKHLGDDQDPFSCRFNLEKNTMKYLMSAEWWRHRHPCLKDDVQN